MTDCTEILHQHVMANVVVLCMLAAAIIGLGLVFVAQPFGRLRRAHRMIGILARQRDSARRRAAVWEAEASWALGALCERSEWLARSAKPPQVLREMAEHKDLS